MNVGLVGCGDISDKHLRAWSQLRGVKLVAVCDEVEEKAAVVAKRWEVRSYYTDLETMLRKEQLRFLSVCTPPLTHTDIVCIALESGVNVICEKPLAMATKEVDRMKEKLNVRNAKLGMICNQVYNPAVIKAQRIFESLQQQPKRVDIQVLKPPSDKHSLRQHWCHSLPGGAFSEFLIHPLYLVRHFLGDLALTSIELHKSEHEWMKYNELQVSLGRAERQARIRTSFNSLRHHFIMDLYGEKNAVRVDLSARDVFLLRRDDLRYLPFLNEAVMQVSVALGNTFRLLEDVASHHLGRIHSSHEANIRLFVDSVLYERPQPLSMEDMRALVNTQEEVIGLIDSYDSVRKS